MTHKSALLRYEINEQHILRAPAITLSDHRAVYDAKCGRTQGGERGVGQMRTGEGGRKRGHFLQTSFMDDPLRVPSPDIHCWCEDKRIRKSSGRLPSCAEAEKMKAD